MYQRLDRIHHLIFPLISAARTMIIHDDGLYLLWTSYYSDFIFPKNRTESPSWQIPAIPEANERRITPLTLPSLATKWYNLFLPWTSIETILVRPAAWIERMTYEIQEPVMEIHSPKGKTILAFRFNTFPEIETLAKTLREYAQNPAAISPTVQQPKGTITELTVSYSVEEGFLASVKTINRGALEVEPYYPSSISINDFDKIMLETLKNYGWSIIKEENLKRSGGISYNVLQKYTLQRD